MKSTFKSKKMFFVLGITLFFLVPFSIQAQCPFGEKYNCLGECGRFYDENGDSFCDNGLVKAEEVQTQTQTTEIVEEEYEKIVAQPKKKQIVQEEIKVEEPIITTQTAAEQIIPEKAEIQPEKKKTRKPYSIILISSIVLISYFATYLLVKAGKMKKLSHRKLWNVILLLTFLASCLLGFVLALQINYGFCMDWFRNFLKWHVEFGIAMTLIAVIHIIWHYKYYINMISKKN
jgi:cation transport ATPase